VESKAGTGNFGDVMVVGGGISGIQASLDLASAGYKVFLVEKAPSIGGKMSQLDKTFPSNDCSMCIESPKFNELARHPNVEILTYTEVDRVEGKAGDFKVTLLKKPRYIIEDKCTGCTTCVTYCPVMIPDPFNQKLSDNKAVHIYFAQATPLVPYIDDQCLYLKDEKCQICVAVCKQNAIDFTIEPEKVDIKVGAIVLSAGYDTFDPGLRGDQGYGKFDNVITSLDYERLLCATGPHEGEVLRPSDKKHPHKIAWIHCVGSRQVLKGGNSYCSAVCCTYIQKQVILAKDHDEEAECTIFHNDIRSYGKDFERFYQRAAKLPGVNFIRSYVSVGREDPVTKNVTIRYATPEGVKEDEFDMVVLGVGLQPPKNVSAMADTFGIELTDHGFCKVDPANRQLTTRPGIYVSGVFQGPVDIPESVYGASGAGAQIGELLNGRRGKLSRERVYPKERDVADEEPKVGVYVCHCGANIGRVVNVPETVEYAKTLPNVIHAEESLFICSTEAAQKLSVSIREKGLNRVVVAACSPRTLEPLFRDTLREAGINQYYYDMANIREHCSWVHSKEPEKATKKAKDIVRMSVARAQHLAPLQEFKLPVNKKAVVVGGGLAGMTCALSIANQGHEVYLIEKEKQLGGMARRVHSTIDGLDVQAYLKELIQKVYKHPMVHAYTDAKVLSVEGFVGNFTTRVLTGRRQVEIKHGATVIATGADELKTSEYLYGQDERVMTQLELEEKLVAGDEKVAAASSVAMIQCVGCRNDDRNYCARICCSHAIKNSLKIKEKNPETEVTVVFRDMRTYGLNEDFYRLAAEKGVKFVRYEPEAKPQVEPAEGESGPVLRVTMPDPILQQNLAIDAELLVLSVATVPSASSQTVSNQFKVATGPDGFFQEAHVKLRPVDFAAEGVYLCGMAHYPKHISETISQAYGAAGRVLTLLTQDTVTASGSVIKINEYDCVTCGACVAACSYQAISLENTSYGKKARVNAVLCKGDGLCTTKCPKSAITLQHYTDDEILSQIDAAAEGHWAAAE
jgi:heterodisulfide reductase subunit A2